VLLLNVNERNRDVTPNTHQVVWRFLSALSDDPIMDFTIFYAWQSDRDQKTHRFLIRDAANEAIKRIGRDGSIDDSPRLDHDTQDVPGTPEIANSIYKKIQDSGVFLADLTFVGTTGPIESRKKLLPNPNVLLELGYAARSIGWERIVCVMNTAFGPPEELIFDRHSSPS
jgi:hypothetical protein